MKVVVAGAGLAGLRAAEALRREGFEGRITIVGDEEVPPYDRPPLSKDVLRGTREPESVYLRSADKLAELELDLLTGTPVHDLDVDRKTIGAGDGELAFDRLIVATGATPRTLPSLEGNRDVLTLRTLDDAVAIAARLRPATRVVVVGAGFIGSEVAASARQLGCEVAIVEQDQAPLSRAIGAAMGAELTRLHLANGTAMHLGMTVERFEDGRVDLSDGTRLEADLVVVGVGVRPNTSWLEGSGIEVDNGVVCDAALTAGHEDVYAIGDVANWDNPLFERRMRVEHWTNAGDQARHVARSVAHRTREPFAGSNYFWSDQYGVRIQFVGIAAADEVAVLEEADGGERLFAAYRLGDRLVGAFGIGAAKAVMNAKSLIESRATWARALQELMAR